MRRSTKFHFESHLNHNSMARIVAKDNELGKLSLELIFCHFPIKASAITKSILFICSTHISNL